MFARVAGFLSLPGSAASLVASPPLVGLGEIVGNSLE